MRACERFLKYVTVYTTSDEDSECTPSAAREFDLAKILVEELKNIGVEDAHVDDLCYVYGTIPASKGYENAPAIGFLSHMDTAPDFSGENVKPVVTENYNGEDFKYPNSDRVLKVSDYKELQLNKGKTLITADGTTLLGADDKAGVAEIMTMAERLIKEDIPHGKVCICFTPDEEIGRGADHVDIEKLGAKYAFTVDGGAENEVEYENFNAASAIVKFCGESIHPGEAKDRMVNAALLAMEYNAALPKYDTPADTEGREGFFHMCEMSGDVSEASLEYIIRDHDAESFRVRKELMVHIADIMNARLGADRVKVEIKDQYQNMLCIIKDHMHLVDSAFEAINTAGLTPVSVPIRGGTDGARLSYMGLPCPNLGTGGYAFHGPYEHIFAESMDKVTEILINIVKIYSEK